MKYYKDLPEWLEKPVFFITMPFIIAWFSLLFLWSQVRAPVLARRLYAYLVEVHPKRKTLEELKDELPDVRTSFLPALDLLIRRGFVNREKRLRNFQGDETSTPVKTFETHALSTSDGKESDCLHGFGLGENAPT